ncbi:hypothetical protein DER44DRAFT_857640 [Fusarium oxysporum]|nr:hypothetical protein DER44DRAFT_857640 [Fusarium oxysporum]
MIDTRKTKEDPEALAAVPSHNAEVTTSTHDAVFGVITEDGPNYRDMSVNAELSLPFFAGLRLVRAGRVDRYFHHHDEDPDRPGRPVDSGRVRYTGHGPRRHLYDVIAALTTWGTYVIGPFKLKHPEIYGIEDATGLVFGPVGRELLSIGFSLCESKNNTFFNHFVTHRRSTQFLSSVLVQHACIRTLSRISFLAWVGLVAILVAISIVTIAVGVQDRPHDALAGPWTSDYKLVNNPSFTDTISAIATFVFANAGTPFYFPIVAEMRDHRDYSKAMLLCQGVVTLTYLVIAIIVYYYCGSYVASLALGSAGPLLKKIGYGPPDTF